MRIIKRYQNRKLYDTQAACYITLEELAQLIRERKEIEVIDNKTKSDITYDIFLQVLFNQERKQKEHRDLDLLKEIICSNSGNFTGFIVETINKN